MLPKNTSQIICAVLIITQLLFFRLGPWVWNFFEIWMHEATSFLDSYVKLIALKRSECVKTILVSHSL